MYMKYFPFFPVIPACDGEDKEIWSLERFLMSSVLNSVVKRALFCMTHPDVVFPFTV